ncbi:MAG: TetR/AcrR family transcriptional regulator [Tannerellaceae bacterium]|jgi:AcrR family transcriptional regulator|nr:TetR/AcrR family transcriptional regulator [Tannerellaceae bacterium]
MYLKEQILMVAFDLFSQYGIKSVSMDDIARHLAISKRTIYETFPDKETLLTEGIEYSHLIMSDYLMRIEKEPHTALEIILLLFEKLMKHPRWYSRKFYEDLKRYPVALEKKEYQKTRFADVCSRIFNRGIKEGVFQADVNFEIMVLLAKEQLKMLTMPQSFSKHSNEEIYGTVLITFLRGISTDKGRAILTRWVSAKIQYNNIKE